MSSAYPSDPPASRTWWPLGLKQSSQHGFQSDKPSRSSGINSIAVALGLKSKKHPVLAIQDPRYPSPRSSVPTIATKAFNRPPSKSVSSIRSQIDSPGPRTPQDPQRDDQRSLFTISDSDPFGVVRAVPQSPWDPNRLSGLSHSSNPDVISKTTRPLLNRVSYASSSSQSNTHGSDFSSLSPTIPDSNKKLKLKKSLGSLHRKQSLMSGDQSLGSAWESMTLANKSKIGSSGNSTLDNNRLSQPEAAPTPRPLIRARGMTDSGQRPDFFRGGSSTLTASSSYMPSGTPSRAVIRQPSISRIGLPPSAPPKQELPPPPSARDHRPKVDAVEPVASVSASSSTLSFASSTSSQNDILFDQHYRPRKKEVSLERSVSTSARVGTVLDTPNRRPSPSAPHVLKKAMSHQTLGRRLPPPASPVSVPLPEPPTLSQAPRKQRSFHHPKFPLTPLSSKRPNTSSSQPSMSTTDSQPTTEQRRGSAGGLSVRKRLFSAGSNSSRRPSTSQSDDSRSAFSVRSTPDQSVGTTIFKPLGQPLSPAQTSSFWDEVSIPEQIPSSPRTVSHEYMPQHIMSPAEMAKLEASVESSTLDTSNRARGSSHLSISSTTSMVSDGGPGVSRAGSVSSSTKTTSIHAAANKLMTRRTSLVQKGLSAHPRLGLRPSTSQLSMTTSTISERSSLVSSPPSHSVTTSLPPPPRRFRPRPTFVDDDDDDDYDPPSLPPLPGRKSVRPRISVEKALHRRSIMRKPSFLEIDDDSDTDVESLDDPPSGSFLDLARESFDTARSISDE